MTSKSRNIADGSITAAKLAPGVGGLPSWWTVDSTPGSEKVTFAGRVITIPTDYTQDAMSYMEVTTDIVDVSGFGVLWGARIAGGSGNWGSDFIYKLAVNDFAYKAAPGEGHASFKISSANNPEHVTVGDSGIFIYSGTPLEATIAHQIAYDSIGLFGVTPVAQQSTPVTLANVIALLRAYGLAA